MVTPRLVAERFIDTFPYEADAALLAQTYQATDINGVDATSVGLIPGALIMLNSSGKAVLAGSAAGNAAIEQNALIGMLMTCNVPGFNDPSVSSGVSINRSMNTQIAALPLSDSIAEVEAYMKKTDAGGAFGAPWAANDLIFASKYGFITKDPTTHPTQPIGRVLEVTALGTLRVQLFRSRAS